MRRSSFTGHLRPSLAPGAILLAALLSLPAYSQQAPSPQATQIAQARQLLESRKPAEAYALLEPLEATQAGNPSFDYLLGIAALDSGKTTRAIFALERVLAVQPENNLARAEIARAYLAAGEPDTARDELTAARQGPMPAEAAAAIDRVLSALAQTGASDVAGIRGYIDLSVGWDSNVNSATSASQFAVPVFGGAIFTLAPGSREQEAPFMAIAGGLNFRKPLGNDLALIASANARSSFNSGQANFNLATLDATAGLAKTVDANTFTGAVQASSGWLGGNTFRRVGGLSAQWQHNLSDTMQVAGFSQWSRISYPGQSIRDADRLVLGLGGASVQADGDRVVFGSVYVAKEDVRASGVPHLGHDAVGARLGAEFRFANLQWFGQVSAEQRRYGGTEPFFTDTRRDNQADISLGVHFVPAKSWRITPQLSYTRNRSNIVLYTYDRAVVQVTARREF